MIHVILWAAGLGLAGCVWAAGGRPEYDRAEKRQGADLAGFAERLAQSLGRAGTVEVFEGLPHPFWEKEVFAAERAASRNFALHDAWFYAAPRKLSAEHRRLFLKIWPGLVQGFRGEKACGGFHADYALRWTEGGRAGAVLLCFGCHEVAAFLPEGSLRADLMGEDFLVLREFLGRYRQQRPTPVAPPR